MAIVFQLGILGFYDVFFVKKRGKSPQVRCSTIFTILHLTIWKNLRTNGRQFALFCVCVFQGFYISDVVCLCTWGWFQCHCFSVDCHGLWQNSPHVANHRHCFTTTRLVYAESKKASHASHATCLSCHENQIWMQAKGILFWKGDHILACPRNFENC